MQAAGADMLIGMARTMEHAATAVAAVNGDPFTQPGQRWFAAGNLVFEGPVRTGITKDWVIAVDDEVDAQRIADAVNRGSD